MLDKTPKLNRIEMVRSDVSGKLFPASECELVIIKIVKAKSEDVNGYNPFVREQNLSSVVVEEGKPATVLPTFTPEQIERGQRKARSAIPPALRDIFTKPPELL